MPPEVLNRCTEKAMLPVEVHAVIHLPKNRRININRELDSLLDALEGGVEHVDAIFIRVFRGTGKD